MQMHHKSNHQQKITALLRNGKEVHPNDDVGFNIFSFSISSKYKSTGTPYKIFNYVESSGMSYTEYSWINIIHLLCTNPIRVILSFL